MTASFEQKCILEVYELDATLSIILDANKAKHTSTLDLREVPYDTHLDAELDCLDEEQTLVCKVKITVRHYHINY